jgi:hypothetical protein
MTVYHSSVSTLHVTNGSSAGDTLATFVDGRVAITCDVLHEGPAPRVDGDAWYETRATFLAERTGSNVGEIRADLARVDRAIVEQTNGSASLSGERRDIVLWFEHDLFDQLLLIRTLDLIGGSTGGAGRVLSDPATVSLVCIDRFPGVDRFIGLGQLTADQLASLYPSRRPVTTDQCALASRAWDAFRSPDPSEVPVVARDGAALPFLGDALRRFLAEYPSTTNGLSRTEELALRALSGAPTTAGVLFAATQRQEARPFMGDLPFYDVLRGLASARVPLVALGASARGGDLRDVQVSITDAGRDVVSGRRDHVVLNGIDRWKGGVHLIGESGSPWRWDAARETLVS